MGISRDLYHNGSLEDWATWTMTILNSLTFIITIINIFYLCRNMPKAHHPKDKDIEKSHLQHSVSAPVLHRQKSVQSVLLSEWRNRVFQYFYIISLIPMLIAYPAHYGAQYPSKSIWIFPALDIIVTIAFLSFMQMLIISCDGMMVIQFYLESQQDTVAKFKCGKKENGYLGFKSRLKLCYLIVIKPLIDYIFSYFEYYYGTPNFQNGLRISLRLCLIICTFVPVRGIRMFHESLKKYSRMKRTKAKTNFITCLAPGIQIQQLFISFLFNFDIPFFKNVDAKFRWCCLYGMLICFEMTIFALFVTLNVFNPKDLMLWDDTDILLAEENDNTIIESITTFQSRTNVTSTRITTPLPISEKQLRSKCDIIMQNEIKK